MKFKVGDKVRLTREILYEYACMNIAIWASKELIVNRFEGDCVFVNNTDGSEGSRKEKYLELVPEEPEFKYGEEIEVKFGEDGMWNKAIFLCKIPGAVRFPYACVYNIFKEDFLKGEKVEAVCWGYARKLPHQLTRKEIAEKLGVSEDFTLVD